MVNGWLSSRATFLKRSVGNARDGCQTLDLHDGKVAKPRSRPTSEVVDILQADAERVGLELDSDDGADQRIEITKLQCRSGERAFAKFAQGPVDVVGHQKMIAGNIITSCSARG